MLILSWSNIMWYNWLSVLSLTYHSRISYFNSAEEDCTAASSVCIHPKLGTSEIKLEYEIGLTKDQCEAIEACSEFCYGCESTDVYTTGACYNDQFDENTCGTYTNRKNFNT